MRELSLYIHIPFCVKKCDYCDFLSAPAAYEVREQYLHALFHEIAVRGEKYRDFTVKTIFIGGGTPSILTPVQITELMQKIRQGFRVMPDAEVSMEVNPGTALGREGFISCREAGINRLSIGLQSANDEELKLLGRIHTFSQFETTWKQAREAGFSNLNIDLMAALPGQSVESYAITLKTVCELEPEHISAYSLIIEEGTPFFSRYSSLAEDEEYEKWDRQMYFMTGELLQKYGYTRYEISNYAKADRECRHNLVYWTRGEYLGLGIGAASLINNVRYKNASGLKNYISAQGVLPYEEMQTLTTREQMEEFLFLGLRLIQGISREAFHETFHCRVESVFGQALLKYQKEGLLTMDSERIALTNKGLDLSNYVFAGFLE